MTAAGEPRYDWVRLTYPRGRVDGAYVDGQGWFRPVPSWYFPNRERVFASLDQVRDEPVIVLTSASGIGKSTALAQEHGALTSAAACLVDLKTLGGRQDPVAYLHGATAMPSQRPTDSWHVLLDGFDEALKRVPELVGLLAQWLQRWPDRDRGRLRLRVATRPGVPENMALEEMLRDYWTAPSAVVVRDMAMLTRDDVLHAASQRGVADPDGFVVGLEQRGLVAAASLPVPLTTLLDRAAQDQPLPETAEAVYRLACEQLCDEHSPARQRPPGLGLGLQQVMRCAEHLAAVLEFCGNGVMTTALDAGENNPVRLVDIADAISPGAGGDAEAALSWLTATPLLRSLSEDQWQFAHQGLQGFLAAAYLKDHQISPASAQSLLFAGPGLTRYVHPSHRDVAGWLAWRSPVVFREILGHDPAALLSPDLPAQPTAVRAQVVEALFAAAEHGKKLTGVEVLHRADHPGLGSQLATRLTSAAARQAPSRRQPLILALELTRACPDHAPAAELLHLAADNQIDDSIRIAALERVPAATIPGAADRLDALTKNTSAEVSVTALLKLWPAHISTTELLTRTPASAPETYWRRVGLKLHASDVDDVLAWMRQQLDGTPVVWRTGTLRLLMWMSAFLKPADGEPPQEAAALHLAEALSLLLRDSDLAYSTVLTEARDTWAGNATWRRLLTREVIMRLGDDTDALFAATREPLMLLPPEDNIYWARRAAADTTGSLAALGNPLILTYPGATPELIELENARKDDPRLAELTAGWFASPPTWVQEAEESAVRHTTEIDAELERLFAQRPDPGEIRSWWLEIVQWLNRNPQHFDPYPVAVRLDLNLAVSCPAPENAHRLALQAAAQTALERAPIMTASQISSVVTFADASEITALSVLKNPPDLAPQRWAGLALILAFANCDQPDQQPRNAMLAHAVAQGGAAFAEALPDALTAISPQWTPNVVATLVGEVDLGEEVNQAVLDWAADPHRTTAVWCDIMEALAPYDRASLPVLNQLAQLADQDLPEDADDAQQRWAQAVDLQLLYGPPDRISSRWEQVLASDQATSAWAKIAERFSHGYILFAHSPIAYWPTAYQALTPVQAGQLYDRLAQQGLIDFPRENAVASTFGSGRRGVHDRLPELIAEPLTATAARELEHLAKEHPGNQELPRLAADHARRLSENLPPLTLAQFSILTTDPRRRIVRNITELTQVVTDALDTLQEQALWSHGWSMIMWNRANEAAEDGWWPTWEDNLSNLICAFLREHLTQQKPVINREVEIHPSNLDGGRTDVHIQATDPSDTSTQPLTVIIEVKGCWNTEIRTGIPGQLGPYLQPRPGWAESS
jgi:hypothetical protein